MGWKGLREVLKSSHHITLRMLYTLFSCSALGITAASQVSLLEILNGDEEDAPWAAKD